MFHRFACSVKFYERYYYYYYYYSCVDDCNSWLRVWYTWGIWRRALRTVLPFLSRLALNASRIVTVAPRRAVGCESSCVIFLTFVNCPARLINFAFPSPNVHRTFSFLSFAAGSRGSRSRLRFGRRVSLSSAIRGDFRDVRNNSACVDGGLITRLVRFATRRLSPKFGKSSRHLGPEVLRRRGGGSSALEEKVRLIGSAIIY